MEQRWLNELQRGIPLEPFPFKPLARGLGCNEDELIAFVSRLRDEGVVRRFGGVFDARRLGWRSVLCAMKVPSGELDRVAAEVTPLDGVTHCYERRADGHDELPNLWFTLAAPDSMFHAAMDNLEVRVHPHHIHVLPALKRFKVDVIFGADTREREESVEHGRELGDADLAIVRALQGDTEVTSDYFGVIAARAGVTQWKLLSTLEMWKRSGRLKRVGLLLAHRNAGWTHNGMCCWRVEGDTLSVGRALAACGEVTHCYERPLFSCFPYNLFAMIHCRSRSEADASFARLDDVVASANGKAAPSLMLLSTREFKKSSLMV